MNTDKAWRRWGEIDPYYGVLSSEEYRRQSLERNRSAFFESGVARVERRLRQVEQVYGELPRGRALDFGCGVGRLVIPLSRRFTHVVGVDISPAMLLECSRNLIELSISNVELVPSDDSVSKLSDPFDFVHSYIVLQHIPVERGMRLIHRLLELTAVGGVASIQLTVDRGDTPARALLYGLQRRVPGVQLLTNLLRHRPLFQPLVEMNEYPLPDVLKLFASLGFGDVTIDAEKQGRVRSVDLLARRLTSFG